ncbi:hypothetical protein ACVRZC_01495 [Streptococcus hyointestinalis]|uniref:Uncharacterized protein n=1 Tax=Streptococcus hyointestinalis TaxID=1337 RepID=A0A380K7I5_9STRE|nr:hypothetical protein [Streptococcus hyointestinalis]SUN60609.1 Uncharacterised protein [Streptococcus hyointestinalis]
MVVIKKRSNIIPIDFGEFQLEYNVNDKGVNNLEKYTENLKKEWDNIQKLPDKEAQKAGYDLVKKNWVDLFGEEAFTQVYALAGDDSVIALDYLMQTLIGIPKEYESRNSADVIKKYLED